MSDTKVNNEMIEDSGKVSSAQIQPNSVSSADISNASIVDTDISPSAAIALNKFSSPGSSSDFLKGDGSFGAVDLSAVGTNAFNVGVLGFKMAVNEGLTVFNLVDGVVDEFNDESGIDTSENTNATYDSTSDFYSNQSGPNPVPAPQAQRTSFTTVGPATYSVPATTTGVNVLVIGGGGAGAGTNQYTQSGGGGAGGLTYLTNLPVTSGASIPLYVGSGGGLNPMNNPVMGWTGGDGENYSGTEPHTGHQMAGEDSTFGPIGPQGTITAEGGGRGDGYSNPYGAASPTETWWQTNSRWNHGGSGGGAAQYPTNAGGESTQNDNHPVAPFGVSEPQGHPGGIPEEGLVPTPVRGTVNLTGTYGTDGGPAQSAGGANNAQSSAGGGAAEPGGEAAGGDGLSYNIADGSTQTYYAGGGSAVPESTEPQGGGGTSNAYNSFADPGTVNTGSGGGGGAANYNNPSYSLKGYGGYGGSGIVIVADATQLITNTSMTLISDTFTANSTPSKARLVVFAEVPDDLNTDFSASVTRDDTTFNAVTLTDEGYQTGSSGVKIFTGSTPLTGSASPQVQLRWKIVGSSLTGNNKIHGVSLQWA